MMRGCLVSEGNMKADLCLNTSPEGEAAAVVVQYRPGRFGLWHQKSPFLKGRASSIVEPRRIVEVELLK